MVWRRGVLLVVLVLVGSSGLREPASAERVAEPGAAAAVSGVPRPADDLAVAPAPASLGPTAPNPIKLENTLPGTDAWRLGRYDYRTASDIVGQIKGYAAATSVNVGASLAFQVSVSPAQSYSISFYRMGWYGGKGGRLMLSTAQLTGRQQPACPTDTSTGTIACSWAVGYRLSVPATWRSGMYLALLTNAQGYQNYVPFVVREDARHSALLVQQPVATYQAYNRWPDDGRTGKSLYEIYSAGGTTLAGTTRAVSVSFDRPYADDGSGEFFSREYDLVRWLERNGFDVSYSTSVDTNRNGAALLNHDGFVSGGHDEYWSREMYDAATAARDAGVNLAFLAANDVYWQVRFGPSAAGVPDRLMVCYKSAALDPTADPRRETTRWRQWPLVRPEQALLGVQFVGGLDRAFPWVVRNADHWLYSGTGLHEGDTIPYLVAGEADALFPGTAVPPGDSQALLSASPIVDKGGTSAVSSGSIYRAPSGAWVFTAGTFRWPWYLDRLGYADARIQRATANLLNRFSDPVAPVAAVPTAALAPAVTTGSTTIPVRLRLGATDGATGVAGYEMEMSTDGAGWVPRGVVGFPSFLDVSLAPAHAYRFRVRARDGAANWSEWVAPSPFTLGATGEDDAAVTYSGAWSSLRDASAFGGSLRVSTEMGATATLAFTGHAVAWVAGVGPDSGAAQVSLDGGAPTTVDLWASAAGPRRVVFTKTFSADRPHLLTIRSMGTAGHARIGVDGFAVLSSAVLEATP